MKLSGNVKAIRGRFVAAFPVPSINSGEDQQVYEERARQWSIHLAEQIAFELPGQGYGVKRGDSGRPICKDCLARSTDGQLLAWDMLRGASSGHPALNDDPDSMDLTGPPDGPQFFEDRPQFFNPQNRLGAVAPPGDPPVHPPAVAGQTLAHYFAAGTMIRKLYKTELKRDVLKDPDALVNWLYHWREEGMSEAAIRAAIRSSDEWKAGHP